MVGIATSHLTRNSLLCFEAMLEPMDTEDADLTDFPKAIEAYVRHLNCLINEATRQIVHFNYPRLSIINNQ